MCQEHKMETIRDGRFIYQQCNICGEMGNIVYLGPKENKNHEEDYSGI
jgi:hypothetical protein